MGPVPFGVGGERGKRNGERKTKTDRKREIRNAREGRRRRRGGERRERGCSRNKRKRDCMSVKRGSNTQPAIVCVVGCYREISVGWWGGAQYS